MFVVLNSVCSLEYSWRYKILVCCCLNYADWRSYCVIDWRNVAGESSSRTTVEVTMYASVLIYLQCACASGVKQSVFTIWSQSVGQKYASYTLHSFVGHWQVKKCIFLGQWFWLPWVCVLRILNGHCNQTVSELPIALTHLLALAYEMAPNAAVKKRELLLGV